MSSAVSGGGGLALSGASALTNLPPSAAVRSKPKIVQRRGFKKKGITAGRIGTASGATNAASGASATNETPSLHKQQSSMAALLTHEEVDMGLEAPPVAMRIRDRRRERPLSPTSALRRLGVVASYSPYGVSVPVLLSDLGTDRFREASRAFWGVVVFCDISGFTKLAEALALGNEPAQAAAGTANSSPPPVGRQTSASNYGYSASSQAAAAANAAAAAAASTAAPTQSDQRRWLQRAGADTLVTIINQIFNKIVSLIISHGGDVIKFAGDALLSVWRPNTDSSSDVYSEEDELEARSRCCLQAARALLEISAAMANFEAHGVKMSVHSGMAAGPLVELHLGGFKGRWEYLIAGQPILSMGKALDVSQSGDVVAHSSVWEFIQDKATAILLDEKGNVIPKQPFNTSNSLISSSNSTAPSASTNPISSSASLPLARLISVQCTIPLSQNLLADLTQGQFATAKRERAEEALSSYIPEPAMALMQSGKELITGELRQVTILFISLPDFEYHTLEALRRNQSAVVIIQQVLYRFDGVMRQLIQDDKGTVCIVAFGLPFSTHEDDPLRGVLSAIVIKKNLETQLGMKCCIGVTTGDAWIGVVGNESRCEYSIVGDSVNLSARLMGHATKLYASEENTLASNDPSSAAANPKPASNGGVLCDGDTESHISQGHDSSHGIHFQAQGRIPVKGRKHEVNIFTPLFTDQAQTIGKPDLLMFGRRAEMQLITTKMEALKEGHQGGVLVIEGEAGMGKCWGAGTRMLLADGSVRCVEDLREGDALMGEDFIPRFIQKGSLIGYDKPRSTLDDEREFIQSERSGPLPATYRIRIAREGFQSWTCNNHHILVLRFNPRPYLEQSLQQSTRFSIHSWRLTRNGGAQSPISYIASSFNSPSFQSAQSVFNIWRAAHPQHLLEFQLSVDQFLQLPVAVQQQCVMFTPALPSHSHFPADIQNLVSNSAARHNSEFHLSLPFTVERVPHANYYGFTLAAAAGTSVKHHGRCLLADLLVTHNTRIVQEVVTNINMHSFLPDGEKVGGGNLNKTGVGDTEHSISSMHHSIHSYVNEHGGHWSHEPAFDQPSHVRVFFGSGNSMTSKIAYSIWRNIIPGLLTELVEGRLHNEESVSSRNGGFNENGSDTEQSVVKVDRRATTGDGLVLIGSHGVARIQSAGVRRKQPVSTAGNAEATEDDPIAAAQAVNQAHHAINQHSKHLITEQLLAAGLHEEEFCLINRFFPNNPYLQFPESSRVAKLKPLQIARKLSKVILNLLVANYAEYGPLLLVLENIQWLDTMSWRVVDRLTRRVINGVTILLTTRPASFSQNLKAIVSRPHTTYIKLEGLDQRDIEGLCCLRLKVPSMPRQMAEMITKASNGNPLFVQELLLSLQQTSGQQNGEEENSKGGDSSADDSDHSTNKKRRPSQTVAGKARRSIMGAGPVSSTREYSSEHSSSNNSSESVSTIAHRGSTFQKRGSVVGATSAGPSGYSNSINALFSITASMQQIMTSRIDKLTPRQQEILKAASVIGMNFSSRLVSMVCSHINASIVEKELVRMDTMGFIVMYSGHGSAAASAGLGSSENVMGGFRHAVMQDVTYKLMSKADRSALHLKVAEALEFIENSREAVRFLPHFTTLGRFMLPAWMDGQEENTDLVAAGLVDEYGNVLVEVDENGEPILDENGHPIPIDRSNYPNVNLPMMAPPPPPPVPPPVQSPPMNSNSKTTPSTNGSSNISIKITPDMNGSHDTDDIKSPVAAGTSPPLLSFRGQKDAPPNMTQAANLLPSPLPLHGAQSSNTNSARSHISRGATPGVEPSHSTNPVNASRAAPAAAAASSNAVPAPAAATVSVASGPDHVPPISPRLGANDPRDSMDAPFVANGGEAEAERGDAVPEISELVDRANAAKDLAYHFNMAGVVLKALVYWDLASAIFLSMQEASESKKLMELAVGAAVILAPIKHVKLFTPARATPSSSEPDVIAVSPKQVSRNLAFSASTSQLSSNSPSIDRAGSLSSAPSTPHNPSTVGSLRLCDALCLAKWERRLGESCRLLEDMDEAQQHLMQALKHLHIHMPSPDTALLNPQHESSLSSNFLSEGSEGPFERVSFLTEVANVLLIMSQCNFTSRPHEPLIGMHSSYLCLQAAQKAGHVGMMAAAYADLLLGCLSLGDLELVEIYYTLAQELVVQLRETPYSSDASSSEMAKLLSSLAAVNLSFGRWTESNACWMEAYQLHRKHGDSFHLQECIQGLALLHRLSGHLSLSSALYSRLQHIASHQQHATSPYFLPRAMLGLIENLVLSGANDAAQSQLKVLLLKGEEIEEDARAADRAGGIVQLKEEASRSQRPGNSRHNPREASSMISGVHKRREPSHAGNQWASQPDILYRWKAVSLLLRWEEYSGSRTQASKITAEVLSLLTTSNGQETKPAWNSVIYPGFHQLEAASALTQIMCGEYFERLKHVSQWREGMKRPKKNKDGEGNSSNGVDESKLGGKSKKEVEHAASMALINANVAFNHYRRLAEKLPIGKPRLLIWQGVLSYAPGRVGQSMDLWLEAASLARKMSLPRDVGLACYWLSQVEVIPAPWWACCLFFRSTNQIGAPSEEWKVQYRNDAIEAFTECGFGMKALGLVAPLATQQQLVQRAHHNAPKSHPNMANLDASLANMHVDESLHVFAEDDHHHIAEDDHHIESKVKSGNKLLPPDLHLDDMSQSIPVDRLRLDEPEIENSHIPQPKSSSPTHKQTADGTSADASTAAPVPKRAAEKKRGIGHFSHLAVDDAGKDRKARVSVGGDEEDSDSEDSGSDVRDGPQYGQSMRAKAAKRKMGPSASKYQASAPAAADEDDGKSVENSRAAARRRRHERSRASPGDTPVAPPSVAPSPTSASTPAPTASTAAAASNLPPKPLGRQASSRAMSRQTSRQSSLNRRTLRHAFSHGSMANAHGSSSESDDENKTSKAVALAAMSPHMTVRPPPDLPSPSGANLPNSPSNNLVMTKPAPSPSNANESQGELMNAVTSPRAADAPTAVESEKEATGAILHPAQLSHVPSLPHTRRNSINTLASIVPPAGTTTAAGGASATPTSHFLSPSAGPKGLEAFRSEVVALNTGQQRPSFSNSSTPITPSGMDSALPPYVSRSVNHSRAVTPAGMPRRKLSSGAVFGDHDSSDSPLVNSMNKDPATVAAVALVGTLPHASTTGGTVTPSMNLLGTGGPSSAVHSRRNSLVLKSLLSAAQGGSQVNLNAMAAPAQDSSIGSVYGNMKHVASNVTSSLPAGDLFVAVAPQRGLAGILGSMDLQSLPLITPLSGSSSIEDPNAAMVPITKLNSAAFMLQNCAFNFIPKQILFRFLTSSNVNQFLTSSISESFDAVVLAVNYQLDPSLSETDAFRQLSNLVHIILGCVIQFDGRLVNAVNRRKVLIMWEANQPQQRQQQHGSGLNDLCRKARACAMAIKAKVLAATDFHGKRPSISKSGINPAGSSLSLAALTAVTPSANNPFEKVRMSYVIAAGPLIVVECPGVQQSVRQYFVLGHLVQQVVQACQRATSSHSSPRRGSTVGKNNNVNGTATNEPLWRQNNHQIELLGVVSSILGGTRSDGMDSQVLAIGEGSSSSMTSLPSPSMVPNAGPYSLELTLHGMQPISEDPDSARWGSSPSSPNKLLSAPVSPPIRNARLEEEVAGVTIVSAVDSSLQVTKLDESALSPSHLRQPLPAADEEYAYDSSPRLTNVMVLQKIGQFCDATLLKRAFALFIPRLHNTVLPGAVANEFHAALSTASAMANMPPALMPIPAPTEVTCMIAYFSFSSLDDITGHMSLGLGSGVGPSGSTETGSISTHRAFTSALNTLIQVLRYLLTLFPNSHSKIESVGNGLRVMIVMEQNIMALCCAIRLLSSFQDVQGTTSNTGSHDNSNRNTATSGVSVSNVHFDSNVINEDTGFGFNGASIGAPVSCCIGLGSGPVVMSGFACAEANNHWGVVGPAVDRAQACANTSLALTTKQEQVNRTAEHFASQSVSPVTDETTDSDGRRHSQNTSGSSAAPFRAMDNSYRVVLCERTYELAAAVTQGVANCSVVVERVEIINEPTLPSNPNGSSGTNGNTSLPSSPAPTFKRTISTSSISAALDSQTAQCTTYRLIRLRHPLQYKLAQTSLCGRWRELETLMSLLPTLDRIPRSESRDGSGKSGSPHPSPRQAGHSTANDDANTAADGSVTTTKPGAFVLLTGESGVGKTHLMSSFRAMAARTMRERIFTVRLNAADQSTPWGCLRALVAAILELESKHDARFGPASAAAVAGANAAANTLTVPAPAVVTGSATPVATAAGTKSTLTTLFQQTLANMGGQTQELLPYLACLNSLLPVNSTFAETRQSKQLSSGDRAEFTLTLLTYLFVFLLEPRPFLLLIHNGEFIDSLSWVGIKRISANFSKSYFLVSAGAISAMDRSTNAGPMLANLHHYHQNKRSEPASITDASGEVNNVNDNGQSSSSLSEFAYTEIELRNLAADEVPSVIMNYLGLVHVAASFLAFMIRQTAGHPQLLIHSLELMLSHGSLQDPTDLVVYNLEHVMFGYANANALQQALNATGPSGAAALASSALVAAAGGVVANGMSSVLGLHPAGATPGIGGDSPNDISPGTSSSAAQARPAQVSMHELTQERLNSLTTGQTWMLRVASVIGTSFEARIIRTIHPANVSEMDSLASRNNQTIGGNSGATPRLTSLYLSGLSVADRAKSVAFPTSTVTHSKLSTERSVMVSEGGFEQILIDDLNHLMSLDLIQESSDSGAENVQPSSWNDYVFSSSAIRDLVYNTMDRSERMRLHSLVAKFYEREARLETAKQKYEPNADTTADDALSLSRDNLLAYHWRQAGDQVKMFIYTLSSARKSLRLHANREATQLYTQAIALRHQLTDGSVAMMNATMSEETDSKALLDSPMQRPANEAQTSAAGDVYSPRSKQLLAPLEVLHFELSTACRNLSMYRRGNENLLQVLHYLDLDVLAPYVLQRSQSNSNPDASGPSSKSVQSSPSAPAKVSVVPIAPLSMDAERAYFMTHLDWLDRAEEGEWLPKGWIIGPTVQGVLVPATHPAWLLAAKSFEKIAENSLRTEEALLGFHAIMHAVELYAAMERMARKASVGSLPVYLTDGHVMYDLDQSLSTQANAYGLLSIYCGAFGFPEWEERYLLKAKDIFLSNPVNMLPEAPANNGGAHSSPDYNAGADGRSWNARVTLSNYESMYLIGRAQLDDALNLLIDMQQCAADTFLGGHRSHRDLLFNIGALFFLQGDYQQTALALEDVLALARAHKDMGVEAACLNLLAFLHLLVDAPYEALDCLAKSKSLASHSTRKSERNILCHTLLALTHLRLTLSPSAGAQNGQSGNNNGAPVDVGNAESTQGRSNPRPSVNTAGSASATTVDGPNMTTQRALDSIYQCQHSIELIFKHYSGRIPLLWHDILEHMGLATYFLELISWIGGHFAMKAKEEAAAAAAAQAAATSAAANSDATATFSSSNPASPFAPLSEAESSQLKALLNLSVRRLKVVHGKLRAFEQRFPWSHAFTSIVSGALIMLCGESAVQVPMELEAAIIEETLDSAVNGVTGASPSGLTSPSFCSGVGPSKVSLSAALECWQSGMKVATEHHLTHFLAHSHFLFGLFLRVQDPARRVHLQTARAIWNANTSYHYSNLAAAALCHLSYFDLGSAIQNRFSPFTPYSHTMTHLHAEKSAQFTLVTPSIKGVASKGILRHQSPAHASVNGQPGAASRHVSVESTSTRRRIQLASATSHSAASPPHISSRPSSGPVSGTNIEMAFVNTPADTPSVSNDNSRAASPRAMSPDNKRPSSPSNSRKVAPSPNV